MRSVLFYRIPPEQYTRLAEVIQGLFILFCAVWFQLVPLIPSIAISFTGAAAVIMAVRAEFKHGKLEQPVWIVITVVLLAIEMHVVYKERAEYDAMQAETRRTERDSFSELLRQGGAMLVQGKDTNEEIRKLSATFTRKPSTATFDPKTKEANAAAINAVLNKIHQDVSGDPKRYLAAIANKIDNGVRFLLARSGRASSITDDPKENATELGQFHLVSQDLMLGIKEFLDVEARLSGTMGTSQHEFIQTGKTGAFVLKALADVPLSHVIVVDSDLALYADEARTLPLLGVGVLLETTEPNKSKHLNVYPTLRVGYYKKGMDVSWEWTSQPIWPRSYYLDKTTKTVQAAFLASANFNGRNIKEFMVKPRS